MNDDCVLNCLRLPIVDDRFVLIYCRRSEQCIQHTAYSIQHTAYSIQHTAYSIQHTAYNIQHTTQTIDNNYTEQCQNLESETAIPKLGDLDQR